MPTPIVDLILGDILAHDHSEADLGATLDSRYVNVTGDTMTGNLILNDNVSVLLGTGSDGELFHDGSNTYFQNNTGNIIIENDASDGDITFKVNDGGVDKTVMTLDGATGNVGIGTTSPQSALDIGTGKMTGGTNSATYRNYLDMSGKSTFAAVDFVFPGGTSNTGGFFRAGQIDVAGTDDIFFQAIPKTTSGYGYLEAFNSAGLILDTGNDALNSTSPILFQTNRNTKMTILSGGNVGIGTTAPAGRLHINGTADDQQLIVEAHSTQTNNIVEIHDSSSNVLISFNGVGGAVFNEQGSATADFRVESDTEANMLFVDANANTDGSVYLGGTTNGIEIKKGGDLTLLGTAKYERHVQIPAMANGLPANQPAEVDFFTAGGLQFASAGAQYAYCQWEIPDDWDGTDIVFEIDWFPDSGAISGTDAIRWTVEYRAIAEGELINQGTSVTVDNGVGGDTTDYAQYETKHSRFTLTYNNANQPLTAQDHVYFKISRDTSVANDFAGTVTVAAYEVIYQSKGLPSSN